MKIKKVDFLPVSETKHHDVMAVVNDFKKSKAKFVAVEEEWESEVEKRKVYNSFYQACKRDKTIKVTRINGKIYLCKLDKQGNEV